MQIFRNQHEDEIKKNEWNDSKEIMTYLENCVRICWLFAIQDPPMELLWPKEQSKLDDHLTEFTKRGNVISFVVWPSLYLHANGPLMCKGVVQPVWEQLQQQSKPVIWLIITYHCDIFSGCDMYHIQDY